MTDETIREGGCGCGAVRFKARGEPLRVGLCHCMNCRKANAATCLPFVVYRRNRVEMQGEIASWQSTSWYDRRFCPACGSRVAGLDNRTDEIELSIGSFDEIGLFEPQYENWVIRREPWLEPLAVPQNPQDRPGGWSDDDD